MGVESRKIDLELFAEVTLHRADRTYFAAPTVNYNERKLVMQQQYKSGRSVDDVPARDQSTHYLSNNFKRNIADNTGVSDNELLYPVTEELRTQDEENALHYRLQRVDDAEDVAYLRELELPQGPVTEDMYLTAPLDTAFLHGQRPIRGEGPPVYAHIHACYTPLTSPTRTLPMELLLEPSPEGKLIEARSLRHQIQTLQHPLPRYRRRRLRARARGRRSIPGQENDPSNSTQQFKEPTRRHASLTTGTHGHHFTITYWFFYPYNHGKEICTTSMIFIGRVAKPLYKGKCHGETVVMGNHVGDWEHLSIYFEATHNFGAFYTYQPAWNRFEYTNQDVREGVFMKAKYPRYLELQQGRLVVYSARGSHGTWPHKGVHLYNDVMVRLEDEAEQGYLWDTRHRVHVIDSLAEKRGKPIGTH
ncbi:hypothetical protein HAZT_HAZT008820, partial [Hyalella azteca]